MTAEAVIAFWEDAGPDRWFAKDPDFDTAFRDAFLDLHATAAGRGCDEWCATPRGSLALALLLDQFPRNAFRGTAHMYATDPLARHFARGALAAGHDAAIAAPLRLFLYLPFAHSEAIEDQDLSVTLNATLGEPFLTHARDHRDIIRRFGRFPHRNAMLARETTAAEKGFLEAGGFAG